MDELISRQAAIKAIKNLCEECDNGGWCGGCRIDYPGKDAKSVLEALPPAEPHTYRGVTLNDVMMYFDSLEGNEDAWTEFCCCLECRGWGLYHIRSATDKNVEANEDCISRQAAIDLTIGLSNDSVDFVRAGLKALPPVTPKQPEQRTEALKAEIRRMKRAFKTCINSDYYTGYMSALSAVERCIAQLEGKE